MSTRPIACPLQKEIASQSKQILLLWGAATALSWLTNSKVVHLVAFGIAASGTSYRFPLVADHVTPSDAVRKRSQLTTLVLISMQVAWRLQKAVNKETSWALFAGASVVLFLWHSYLVEKGQRHCPCLARRVPHVVRTGVRTTLSF